MDGHKSYNKRKKLWDQLSIGIESSRLVVVHLTKGDEGNTTIIDDTVDPIKSFGFNIRGGVDHPHIDSDPGIFITTVKADSAAGKDGRLEPGDRILALNDIRLDCVTHNVAVNEFRKVDESVSMLVEKNAEAHLQSPQYSNSTDSYFDGPPRLDSMDGDSSPPITSLLRQFYESPLGALAIGLAAGSLAVFIALRIYKASKS